MTTAHDPLILKLAKALSGLKPEYADSLMRELEQRILESPPEGSVTVEAEISPKPGSNSVKWDDIGKLANSLSPHSKLSYDHTTIFAKDQNEPKSKTWIVRLTYKVR